MFGKRLHVVLPWLLSRLQAKSMGEPLGHGLWMSSFKATNKAFPKEVVRHVVHSEIQFLKSGDILFHCTRLFHLGQMAQMMCVCVKEFINICEQIGSKKHTLYMNFYAISTISSVQDPNKGH
jgi:hypothetical protein